MVVLLIRPAHRLLRLDLSQCREGTRGAVDPSGAAWLLCGSGVWCHPILAGMEKDIMWAQQCSGWRSFASGHVTLG